MPIKSYPVEVPDRSVRVVRHGRYLRIKRTTDGLCYSFPSNMVNVVAEMGLPVLDLLEAVEHAIQGAHVHSAEEIRETEEGTAVGRP